MPSTVQPSEVTAMIVAVLMLLIWFYNIYEALRSLRMVRKFTRVGDDNGRGVLIQARLAVFEPMIPATVQCIIIGLMVMMMTFDPNPDSSLRSRWSIAGGAILVSLLLGLWGLVRKIAEDRTKMAQHVSVDRGEG